MSEPHLGRERQSPETKEPCIPAFTVGAAGGREGGGGRPPAPHSHWGKPWGEEEGAGAAPGEPRLQSPLIFVGISLFIFFVILFSPL